MIRTAILLALCLSASCTKSDPAPLDTATVAGSASASAGASTSDAVETEGNSPATPPAAPQQSIPTIGRVHQVRMIADAAGARFEPSSLEITQGDIVHFIVAGGGPHNAVFDGNSLSSDAQTQLSRNMSDRQGPLATAMQEETGETATVSFANMPPGDYPYQCASHSADGMRGSITVR